jgi:uncharacterized membrane protein YcaP (DUF421 family)
LARDCKGLEATTTMAHLMPMQSLSDMFLLPIPLFEKIARPIAVYLFLILCFRLSGKRMLAQLNPFDLVVLLILSNTVQNAIIGNDNSVTGGLIGAVTLLAFNSLVVRGLSRHEWLERWVEGKPDAVVENGRLCADTLRREGISRYELEVAAHKQGFDSLNDVERAMLAPGGTMLFFRHVPTTDEARQKELVDRLARIERLISGKTPPAAQ